MKQIATKGIVLKRVNYGEADRILTVLTKDAGLVSLFAKGVRLPKSKLAGGLELFSVADICFIEGKRELKTITSARMSEHFGEIIKQPDATLFAYEAMKLLASQAEHSTEPFYFDLLEQTLRALHEGMSVAVVSVWFALRLLDFEGRGINLERPLNADSYDEAATYQLSYDDMALIASERGTIEPIEVKFMRVCTRLSRVEGVGRIANCEAMSERLREPMQLLLKLNHS